MRCRKPLPDGQCPPVLEDFQSGVLALLSTPSQVSAKVDDVEFNSKLSTQVNSDAGRQRWSISPPGRPLCLPDRTVPTYPDYADCSSSGRPRRSDRGCLRSRASNSKAMRTIMALAAKAISSRRKAAVEHSRSSCPARARYIRFLYISLNLVPASWSFRCRRWLPNWPNKPRRAFERADRPLTTAQQPLVGTPVNNSTDDHRIERNRFQAMNRRDKEAATGKRFTHPPLRLNRRWSRTHWPRTIATGIARTKDFAKI